MAEKNLRIKLSLITKGNAAKINGLRKLMNLFGSSLKAVFRTGIVAGFFAILRAGIGVVNNLKNSIRNLGSEFLQLRLKATETAAIISKGGAGFQDAFEEAITMSRKLSTQIGFSARDIQEGMVTAARSGLGLQESLQMTGTAMQLATAHGEQFQNTINDLIGVSRAFGVELQDLPAFADALSTAVTKSNVSLSGLFQGMKRVASVASVAFGETQETINDTTAALMTLNDAGIQGQKAGTRLRAAMQKLLGGTAKTTAAFTKYNVNLFKANEESQKYLDTLTKGQKAMAGAEDKLNTLKKRQFELVIANRESTAEFKENEKELSAVQKELSSLEEGVDNVYRQFTLAGGKLKPFSEILKDIKKNVPTEVIGRAFGIRGGEAIMRLLKDLDKFEGFKASVEEYVEASQKGQSITEDMYKRFLDTVLIGWQRIKNTALGIWGEIADGLFGAIQPMLGPLQDALTNVFSAVSENKGAFKAIFEGALETVKPVLEALVKASKIFSEQFGDILTPGITAEVPTFNRTEDGGIEVGTRTVEGSVLAKLKALLESIGDFLVDALGESLRRLNDTFVYLAEVFANAFADILEGKVSLWTSIGTKIGGSLINALLNAIAKQLPKIKRLLGELGVPLLPGKPKGMSDWFSKEGQEKRKQEWERKQRGESKEPTELEKSIDEGLGGRKTKSILGESLSTEAMRRRLKEGPDKSTIPTSSQSDWMQNRKSLGLDSIIGDQAKVDLKPLQESGNKLASVAKDISETGKAFESSTMKLASASRANKIRIENLQRTVYQILSKGA